MRTNIQEQVEMLGTIKDPYQDTDGKILKLYDIRNRRPDNWRHEVSKVVSDGSGYKLGEKSKDVAIALTQNQKTVAWEKPTGKKDGSGAMMTESVNKTYNPTFQDFNPETGEITDKTQLDYDFLNKYLEDNKDHQDALQTRRVDEQDAIIDSKIDNNEELTPDEKTWSTMTNMQKLQKSLNDDLLWGVSFAKKSKEQDGIGTQGRGASAYDDRFFRQQAQKEQEVLSAIKNDANTIRTRGIETLNALNLKDGSVPGSFKIRDSKSTAGDDIIVIEYEKRTPQMVDRGDGVMQERKGKFDVKKIKETFFADDDDALAKFYRDRAGYNRTYGPEALQVRTGPIEYQAPKKEIKYNEDWKNLPQTAPGKEDPLGKFLK
jgi:hypothetical protein